MTRGTPRSLNAFSNVVPDPVSDVVPSREVCNEITARVARLIHDDSGWRVVVYGEWQSDVRWARNVVTQTTGSHSIMTQVLREGESGAGGAWTNQTDDASLRDVVRKAYDFRRLLPSDRHDRLIPWTPQQYTNPLLWYPSTLTLDAATGGDVARACIEPAAHEQLSSAGYVAARAWSMSYTTNTGMSVYTKQTIAQCSTTARDPQRYASGWAGLSMPDWSTINVSALASRATEKAVQSRDPVALEPGRYTAIFEPQAVADLLQQLINPQALDRFSAENGMGPFVARRGDSKLGMRVADPRVTIGQDPMTDLGITPFDSNGNAVSAVNWIEDGVLINLAYSRDYALESLNEPSACPAGSGFHMRGGDATVDDMIRGTTRGLLVTRLSNVIVLDLASRLCSGTTRDGLWLIQQGKITKPVRNFRFTDSPLFMLNTIERIGAPVPVFSPDGPVRVPPLQVRDFNFTSLSDSI
jgi:predicted Zn-dependent protease